MFDRVVYDRAVTIAKRDGIVRVSVLQRELGLGYPKAQSLIETLQMYGIVGKFDRGRHGYPLTDD